MRRVRRRRGIILFKNLLGSSEPCLAKSRAVAPIAAALFFDNILFNYILEIFLL